MKQKSKKAVPRRTKPDDKLVAYHEAGHAVVAFHKGGKFVVVDMNGTLSASFGNPCVAGLTWACKSGARRNTGLVLLAGLYAEYILLGCPNGYRSETSRTDRDDFDKLWKTKRTKERNWQKFSAETVILLSKKWRQVEYIAEILLQDNLLSYDEIKDLIETLPSVAFVSGSQTEQKKQISRIRKYCTQNYIPPLSDDRFFADFHKMMRQLKDDDVVIVTKRTVFPKRSEQVKKLCLVSEYCRCSLFRPMKHVKTRGDSY